jgi:hypothetical protein
MASQREQKRISDNVSAWDQFKTLITPGDVSDKQRQLSAIADQNEREAQVEAIRKRRMNAGQ